MHNKSLILNMPRVILAGSYFVVIDSNTGPHRTTRIQNLLTEANFQWMNLPLQLPRMNLIEHMWDILSENSIEYHMQLTIHKNELI